MKKCRITVVKKVQHTELMKKYENPIENACDMQEGQVYIARDLNCPDGLCESAWQSMYPFVLALLCGGRNIYGNWMKNSCSAMVSCNDGFRPVSFYIEAMDEES